MSLLIQAKSSDVQVRAGAQLWHRPHCQISGCSYITTNSEVIQLGHLNKVRADNGEYHSLCSLGERQTVVDYGCQILFMVGTLILYKRVKEIVCAIGPSL
jgi:hypothetical protein